MTQTLPTKFLLPLLFTVAMVSAIPTLAPDRDGVSSFDPDRHKGRSTEATTPGKRGLAYNSASMANVFSGHSQVTWGYNWGYPSQGLSLSFEFVPMLYADPSSDSTYQNQWKANVTAAIRTGTKHLLAFNEPDVNNLTPAAAAASYKRFMQPYASQAKLGAPAVTNGGAPTGLTWLQEFIGNCTSCTIDFVPLHWYGYYYDDLSYFTDYIQNASETAGDRPLWITELNGQNVYWNGPATDDQQTRFMKSVLPWLDSLSYVERYAYFGVFESSDSGAYLMDGAGNGLSESGNMYATMAKVNSTKPAALS